MAKKKAAKKGGNTHSKATNSGPLDAVRHKDKRKNIPTEELRDFVADEEQQPHKVLYPRDPSLDPQLVWKGKDEQDRQALEVPAVPIYIQDKIHPQAIIEDFRHHLSSPADPGDGGHNLPSPAGGRGAGGEGSLPRQKTQLSLFDDFNGLPEEFDQRVDFYHHDGHWSNRLILGDSLLVMTSLAEKEGLKGKVQMVYFDPPYGIKFGSNWQVSTRKRDVKDGKAVDVTRQPEQVQAFRDTWEHGIHSYLPYLRDRLVVARDLLVESGSVFVQIGDENVHLVRCLLDEVFGAENFVSLITFKKTSGTGSFAGRTRELSATNDYLLWYARAKGSLKYRDLYRDKDADGAGGSAYRWVQTTDGARSHFDPNGSATGSGRRFRGDNLTSQTVREAQTTIYPVEHGSRSFLPGSNRGWSTNQEGMKRLKAADRLIALGNTLSFVRFIDDFPAFPFSNLWDDTTIAGFGDPKVYVVQTNTKVVERCLLMTTDPGDLVLDPTCGSGTTAYVAEQWGRRWITTDTSRVAMTLARTRLMAGRFPYYLLADSPDGRRKEAEIVGATAPFTRGSSPVTRQREEGDIRHGFVYKRVPHITLKSIANNEEIDTIDAKWQDELEPVRARINKLLKKNWKEWEVPRELEENGRGKPPAEAKRLLAEWWELRRRRQKELDDSIARRADLELLYDQPYGDNKRVRVAGPFTVESLSPHRTITVEQKKRLAEQGDAKAGLKIRSFGPDNFGHMILENLLAAGVQNTYKKERLRFDTLAPFPGEWIHGTGTYTESGGKVRRVAVCIGPEHGTVGPQLVKEAAKEAVQGVGFDMLVICGFAFDPHVSEEAKRYGKLVVLPTRMNPDLSMGELLKKTGAANLFMVFGEPDLKVTRQKDGQLVVEVAGLDVYDPTTGEIRSSSTDDIACWFIDTNYNEESFFVRHAYFTGADQPYEKLKRALRAEIDESAWSALYSTVSRPFAPPETGKIAVKVINHFGDEVMRVYEVK